jgi:hypothetical protein
MATYYVDSAAASGGDGSKGKPWRTLDRWTPAANDEVNVAKGDGTPYTFPDKIRVGPVKLTFDPDAVIGAITGGAAKGAHCIRMELPFNRREEARGTVIIGGKFGECSSTNMWFGFANGVTVTRTEQTDAAWCNTHFTACDDFTFTFNKCARPHGQHNVYGGNSCKNPVITDNELYHADDAAIHLNGDYKTSVAIFPKQADGSPVPECTGMIVGPQISRNLCFDCGWDGTGGGATGDGVTNAVYEDNQIVSKGWAINVYNQDGASPSTNVTIRRNTIQSHYTCFNLTGVVNCQVVDNTVSPEKAGDVIDLAGVPSPGLVQSGNTETKTPFTGEQLAKWAAAFDPPAPPPPSPPPAPTPTPWLNVPEFPPLDQIEKATPLADTSKYDTAVKGVTLCREWDTQDPFSTPPKFTSLQRPPNGFWGGGNATPKGGFAPPNVAMDFSFLYVPSFTGPALFHFEGEGALFGQWCGKTVLSGEADNGPGGPKFTDLFQQVEEGKGYPVWLGFTGTRGDVVPSLRMYIAKPGDTKFQPIDRLECYPLRSTTPTPVPDPDPDDPPVDPNPTDPPMPGGKPVFTAAHWAEMERWGKLFRG